LDEDRVRERDCNKTNMTDRLPHRPLAVFFAALALALAQFSAAAAEDAAQSIARKTASMKHMPGLLPLDWDEVAGKLYLEIPALNVDLLYVDTLPYGVGSNDLGLDRGQMSEPRIVRFERFGPKVLLVEANERFRTSSVDPAERLALRQSFPESILAAFTVVAQTQADAAKSGAVLVDATDFFLRASGNISE
jgi:hypothetical protein